jgi:NAD-dependent deacetylase
MTGAGVSVASGVPTFRGPGGLWRQFRATDLATPEAFARDPRLVWEWYNWRRETIASCQPNVAHQVLASWTNRQADWRVVTQNVDDLHVRAGTRNLVRLHGSIWELTCSSGCAHSPRRWRDERVPLPELPPKCPACGALARPAVIWFGESLDPEDLRQAYRAAECDVFLTIGTSALVHPAAGLVDAAKLNGAFTAEINPEATPASGSVSTTIRAPAEVVLAEIEALLREPPLQ